MRKIVAFLAGLSLAASAIAQSGPKFSTTGGVGSSTSTYVGGEPNGGTYTINGTTGTVSTPVVNLRPGSAPVSPNNGDCWTTVAGLFCRINGVTVGPYQSSAGAGTVTQVGLVTPSIFTAGGAVTTSGNLSFTLNSQSANQIFAAPNGSSGTPGFRALVGADVPAVNLAGSGNGGVTGTLAIAKGGTGATTAANARTGLGLGTMATQNAATVAITGGSITGITDLAVADGGTGASDATGARTNLGLGTAATQNTGTSGPNVPLLNGANTWSANQTVNGALAANTVTSTGTITASNGNLGLTAQGVGQEGAQITYGYGNGVTGNWFTDVDISNNFRLFKSDAGGTSVAITASPTDGSLSLAVPLAVGSGGTGAATGAANRVFATPNGSSGAPSFRALVSGDLPTWTSSGTGAVARTRDSKLGDTINVKDFGAACNGATGTDSRAGIQAALDYAATIGGTVELPAGGLCRVNTTITIGAGVSLVGKGYTSNSGLAAGATNLSPMVFLDGDGAQIRNMLIVANAAGANTAGMMLKTGVRTQITMRDLYITGPCGAISVDGNLHEVQNVYVYQAGCAGGAVIIVGQNTTLAGSTDVRFDAVVVNSRTDAQRPGQCMLIYDAGGLFVTRSDMLFCGVGTAIMPGANQQVIWGTFVNTYLGDTNSTAALYMTTGASTGVIKGLSFNGGWASSSSGSFNTYIANGNNGIVDGISFTGFRSMGGSGNAISISNVSANGVKNVRIDGSMLCGYGQSGVFADTGVGEFQITDTTIRPDCAGPSSGGVYGVLLAGSNANVTLGALDARNNATANIAGTPTGLSQVYGITGVNNSFGSKAAAGTIALDQVIDKWTITGGSTTISNLTGQWTGRSVTLVTAANQTFATGGNLCNGLTSTANVPVTALFGSTCWFLK